jgi:hypothetical protein
MLSRRIRMTNAVGQNRIDLFKFNHSTGRWVTNLTKSSAGSKYIKTGSINVSIFQVRATAGFEASALRRSVKLKPLISGDMIRVKIPASNRNEI